MTFLIGVVVGLVAFGVQMAVKILAWSKFELMALAYKNCSECFWAPLIVLVGANVILTASK